MTAILDRLFGTARELLDEAYQRKSLAQTKPLLHALQAPSTAQLAAMTNPDNPDVEHLLRVQYLQYLVNLAQATHGGTLEADLARPAWLPDDNQDAETHNASILWKLLQLSGYPPGWVEGMAFQQLFPFGKPRPASSN